MATTARRSGILCRPDRLRKGAVAELRRTVYTAGIRRAAVEHRYGHRPHDYKRVRWRTGRGRNDRADGKAEGSTADARDEGALARVLDDVDVLVNTASYRVNLHAMRACLAAGCAYLDLGGLYWMTGRQLELADEFGRAGLLALLGIGSSPGKTNLMAQRAVEVLGVESGQVEKVDVVAGGRDPVAGEDGRLSPPYALQTLLDELTLAPIVLREASRSRSRRSAPAGSSISASRSGARTRSTRCIPSCARSPTASAAAQRASGCRSRRPCSPGCETLPACRRTMSPRAPRRVDRLDRGAGGGRRSPARAGIAGCGRSPTARAVHRTRRDVRRARDARLLVLGDRPPAAWVVRALTRERGGR